MQTSWIALHIDNPSLIGRRSKQVKQATACEARVTERGGEMYHVIGRHVDREIISFANRHQVARILIGRPHAPYPFPFGGVADHLIHGTGHIPVEVASVSRASDHLTHVNKAGRKRNRERRAILPYVVLTVAVALLTLLLNAMLTHFVQVNIALLFLLPVLIGASLWGIGPGLYTAILGTLCFDYFFVAPNFSFTVTDLRYVYSFLIFPFMAILVAGLSSSLKRQLKLARERERIMSVLYALSRRIVFTDNLKQTLQHIAATVEKTIGRPTTIFTAENDGTIIHRFGLRKKTANKNEQQAIRWVYKNKRPLVDRNSLNCSFRPLIVENAVYGILAIHGDPCADTQERNRLIGSVCNLTALAIARANMRQTIEKAHLAAESERLYTVLLDSISHELRTPLTTVIGSATALIDNDTLFTAGDRLELLKTIQKGATQMNHIVTNLLGMVRLESGMLKLNRQWCDLEDIIGIVRQHLNDRLQGRSLKFTIAEHLPSLFVDEQLFGQALENILGNALKYSPAKSPVTFSAYMKHGEMYIAISDMGNGVPNAQLDHIFDKFFRLRKTSWLPGTGLGLTIVKGIVQAHGGRVRAYNRESGGLTVLIVLNNRSLKNIPGDDIDAPSGAD